MDDIKKGRVILKSIPTQLAKEKVAGYLIKIAKNTEYDRVVQRIARCPVILFKSISEERGKKIAAELIKLGASVSFEPSGGSRDQASNALHDIAANDGISSNGLQENRNQSSAIISGARRSRIPRRWTVAIALTVLTCLLVFGFQIKRTQPAHDTSPKDEVTKHSDRRDVLKLRTEVPQKRDSKKIVSTAENPEMIREEQSTVDGDHATRVGIYVYSSNTPGLCDLPFAKSLSRLLIDACKKDTSLKFIQCEKIDRIIVRNSLSSKQMFDPKEAAMVGRQAGVDILIVGQLIFPNGKNDKDQRAGVVLKAIHTFSLKTVDIGCYENNKDMMYNEWLDRLVEFVKISSASGTSLGLRDFVVVGRFVNRDAQNGPANLDAKLVKYLFRELGNRKHVCVISHHYLKLFFKTMGLNDDGYLPENEMKRSAQPGYTRISGDYSYKPNTDTPFTLDLNVEFQGQSRQNLEISGDSWDDGLKNLGNELDVLLSAKSDLEEQKRLRMKRNYQCEEGRSCEARAHFLRGKELSNIDYSNAGPYLNVSLFADGQGFETRDLGRKRFAPDGRQLELSQERQVQNIRAAINEFGSALFLDPENNETKLFLAVCLSHPEIEEINRSKDLLREVISNSTEDRLKFIAAKAMGEAESVAYTPSFADKYFTPEYFARTCGANMQELLWKGGMQVDWWNWEPHKVRQTLDVIKECIIAHCENVMWQSKKNVEWKLKRAVDETCGALKDITWSVHRNEIIGNYFRELMSTIREKYPRLAPNLIADNDLCASPIFREEFLITLERIEAGEAKPILPDGFYRKLYGNFLSAAASEDSKYQEVGIRIAGLLDKRNPILSYDKLHLACCYKGIGETEEALHLLDQIDGANSPGLKKAFLENSCESFRKIFNEEQSRKQTPNQTKNNARKKRTISSVTKVPGDRIIHAIAQDGNTLWLCANKKQNPNAPSGNYDPVIYHYRIGDAECTSLKLPEKLKGMATSIVARNKTIWVGTDEGLLEIEPERNIFRHLKEDDGLLKPNVNSLSLSGNKLYMGLGSGAGYLDILEHHFTGLITNNEVVRVASSPEGLWVITRTNGLIFFSEKSGKKDFQSRWKCSDSFSLAVNNRYVVIGKNLQIGRTSGMRNVGEGGLIVYDRKLKKKRYMQGLQIFSRADVLSLSFVDDQLWVGGRGFLGVIDLPGHKVVDRIVGRGSAFHALLADNHGGMWVAQGHKLYHLGCGTNGFVEK